MPKASSTAQTVELAHDKAFWEALDLPSYLKSREFNFNKVEILRDEDGVRIDLSCKDEATDIKLIAELPEGSNDLHVCEIDKKLDRATQRSYSKKGAFRARTAQYREPKGFVTAWSDQVIDAKGRTIEFQQQLKIWENFLSAVENKLETSQS